MTSFDDDGNSYSFPGVTGYYGDLVSTTLSMTILTVIIIDFSLVPRVSLGFRRKKNYVSDFGVVYDDLGPKWVVTVSVFIVVVEKGYKRGEN